MSGKKGRSRKTADVMARYKQSARHVRRSPRGKGGTTENKGNVENSPHDKVPRSDTPERMASVRRDEVSKDQRPNPNPRCRSTTGSPGEAVAKRRLVDMTVIHETPERPVQATGRKRISAPLLEESDSQMPSKKRKSFNTPPRSERSLDVDDDKIGSQSPSSEGAEHMTSVPGPLCTPEEISIDDDLMQPPLSVRQSGSKPMGAPSDDQRWPFEVTNRRRKEMLGRGLRKSLMETEDLEHISTSSLTLSRLLESFRVKVVDEVSKLLCSHKAELSEMHDKLCSSVSSNLLDMRGTLELAKNRMKGATGAKRGQKTSLAAWEEKLNMMTPNADVIFSSDVISRILCYNTPWKVVDVFDKVAGLGEERAVVAVQSLLFSLQPGEKKDVYSIGVGLLHSEFLFSVVSNCFLNVSRDRFNIFLPDDTPESSDQMLAISGGHSAAQHKSAFQGSRIKRPSWLAKDYVTRAHISSARKFLETLNQSRKAKVRQTPSPDDVAIHGSVRVYRLLQSHLHQSRDNVRACFFEGLGYLFTPWTNYVKDNEQSILKLHLEKFNVRQFSLGQVPMTQSCGSDADVIVTSRADAANKTLPKELFTSYPGMVLEVEHDVHVIGGVGSQRKHSGGEKRPIRKLINLMQVTCNVVVEYTRVGDIDTYLRAHPCALKCVMVFALLFRSFCDTFIELRNALKGSMPEAANIVVHNMCAKELMPGDNTQSSYLKSRCLRMPEKEYFILHDGDVEDNTNVPETRSNTIVDTIMEDEDLGLACI